MSTAHARRARNDRHPSRVLPCTDLQPAKGGRRLRLVRDVDPAPTPTAPTNVSQPRATPPAPPRPAFELQELAWFALGDDPVYLTCASCDVVSTDLFHDCPRCGSALTTLPGDPREYDPRGRDRLVEVRMGDDERPAWLLVLA